MKRWLGLVLMVSTGIPLSASAAEAVAGEAQVDGAQPPREQGPFDERNQFLFNLLFFAFPARGGTVLPPHASEWLVASDYANTFVGSDILNSFSNGQRARLTQEDLALAQLAEPGDDLFFVDTEQSRTTLTYRWGSPLRIEVDLEIPILSYHGGMFDPAIEWYHRATGLGNGGREFYEQNIVQLALTLGNDRYFTDRSPSTLQIGDVSLTGRFPLVDSSRAAMALSVGFKFPTGNPETLGGSGSPDEGLELEGTVRWGHQRLHLTSGWVHTGTWDLFPDFRPADLWNFGAAYEYAQNPRISYLGQLQTQSSVFRGRSAADGALKDYSTEILVGVKWQGAAGRWFFQTALIENIINSNNGVDIGGLAGFGVRLGGANP